MHITTFFHSICLSYIYPSIHLSIYQLPCPSIHTPFPCKSTSHSITLSTPPHPIHPIHPTKLTRYKITKHIPYNHSSSYTPLKPARHSIHPCMHPSIHACIHPCPPNPKNPRTKTPKINPQKTKKQNNPWSLILQRRR